MRRLWLFFLLTACALPSLSRAQFGSDVPQSGPTPLQKFEGTGTQTTASFQIPASWKLNYHSFRTIKLTVYTSDGKVVLGTAGGGTGILYFPTGGTYYLKIEGSQPPPGQPGANQGHQQSSGILNTITDGLAPANNGNNPGNPGNNPNGPQNRPQLPPNYWSDMSKWTVSIYDATAGAALDANGSRSAFDYTVPSNDGPGNLTSTVSSQGTTPGAVLPPPAAPTPAPAAAPAPVAKLTEEQTRAIVLIRGDNAEGTGFLVKTPDGPAVVTNLHVIGNNPNIKITTSSGNVVTMLSAKGASDRDLALLMIKDYGYSYLDLATDMATSVQAGDEVIATPGNSQGGGVVLSTGGKVLGIGPDRIEFDNPIYHGNSGGPVFDPKTNKVLGVVTMAIKVDQDNDLDKASFASRNSAITKQMRYFGLRLDTVPSWMPLDWRQFQVETTFLDQFHDQSRRLDSFLNPPKQDDGSSSSNEEAHLYLDDKKIMRARDDFIKQAAGTDGDQRVSAFRELLSDLTYIANTDLASAQNKSNFYPFDQERAKGEAAYRKALMDEIDSISSDVSRMNGLANRSQNTNNNGN